MTGTLTSFTRILFDILNRSNDIELGCSNMCIISYCSTSHVFHTFSHLARLGPYFRALPCLHSLPCGALGPLASVGAEFRT